eukprot:scaffold177834_cov34-Prasinocladus_malaysianus.AAC.1
MPFGCVHALLVFLGIWPAARQQQSRLILVGLLGFGQSPGWGPASPGCIAAAEAGHALEWGKTRRSNEAARTWENRS